MPEPPRIHGCSYDLMRGEIVITVDRNLRSGKLDQVPVPPADAVMLIQRLAAAVLAHNDKGGGEGA